MLFTWSWELSSCQERATSMMWDHLESVSWESVHRSCVLDMARLVLALVHELVSVRASLVVLVLNMWRGHGEAWHCVAVLESMKRALDRLLVNMWLEQRAQHFGDTSALGWPPRVSASVSGANQNLETSYLYCRGQAGEVTRLLMGSQAQGNLGLYLQVDYYHGSY